jgi:hypothetical protein
MSSYYVEPRESRFVRERIEGVEQIRIPVRRNWFVLLFLSFWICGWTVGGLAAMSQLRQDFDWFLVFWLGGWLLGWVFAATTISSQLAGSEIIRVAGRDLEISVGVGPLRRRRLYRGDRIRNLDSSDPNPMGWGWWQGAGVSRSPFGVFGKPQQGALKFDYGAETIYAASSADEAEGRMIVDWLKPKLPRSATDLSAFTDTGGAANFRP